MSDRHAMPPNAVAIVGMAGRFPGARSAEELWRLVRDGREAIRSLSDTDLRAAGVPASLLQRPNYVRAAAILDDMDMFDAGFFGFSPRDAAIMDPQHRHFLECAWEALENAGYVPESFAGSIGVFGGCGMQSYFATNLLNNPSLMASAGYFLVRHTGNDKDFLATRVSYQLNLRGPSVSVQTACSTSLVAVHLACQSLLNGECDMALAGGVTIELPHGHGYLYEEGEILSPDGHCRAFDAASKGTVFGSGAGLVVLRRYDDAVAAGDHVHAVIIGSAVNNDGAGKVGYLAPSVDGQAAVVAEAIAVAGVDPESITYIETHGTGTPVGDPIEIAALTDAFGRHTSRRGFCAIGSIKTNIGHLDTAAGVASLIKAASAIEHAQVPPSLHYSSPNPAIPFSDTPFFVSRALAPWTSDGPRRAGVTSLGVGGTNAHVVIQEAPRAAAETRDGGPALLVLSARSASALDKAAARLASHLRGHADVNLDHVAFTLQAGRRAFPHRMAVVARAAEEAAALLVDRPNTAVRAAETRAAAPAVTFMFPGGGAQHPGMAAAVYGAEPVFRAEIDRCIASARRSLGVDVRPLLLGNVAASTEDLTADAERPSLALPALFAIEYALSALLRSWGLTPAACIGHSLGEYTAACLAGVMSVDDAIVVVGARGRLFETLPPGMMVSVPVGAEALKGDLAADLSIAAINGPALSVVSGPLPAVERFAAMMTARGVECQRLRIGVAAHSSMLEPILDEFLQVMRKVQLNRPTLPFISNVTGTWTRDDDVIRPEYWVRHLRSTVQFSAGISALASVDNRLLVEVGPGTALSSIARLHTTPDRVIFTLGRAADADAAYTSVLAAGGELWANGAALDLAALRGTRSARRTPLPTYPFERERHWIDPEMPQPRADLSSARADERDVSQWMQIPVWRTGDAQPSARIAGSTWLVFTSRLAADHEVIDVLRGEGAVVTEVTPGTRFGGSVDAGFSVEPASMPDIDALVHAIIDAGRYPSHVLFGWSATPGTAGQRSFDSLLLLMKALADTGHSGPLRLAVVTSGLQKTHDADRTGAPEQALAMGAVRVLPAELPYVSTVAIDLPRELPPPASLERRTLAALIIDEVLGHGRDQVVALRDGTRRVPSFRSLPPAALSGASAIREDGVFLITGGLGGIALAVADALASETRVRLVLVARSAMPARTTWDGWLASHAPSDLTSDRISRIRAIEARGSRVVVEQADVSDEAAARALVTRTLSRDGAIHGVIHAAGLLDDSLTVVKTVDAARRVLAPKVGGAIALARALEGHALDFWVNCSSVSSIVGLPGQIDYAAANAFLDAFAYARADRDGGRAVSVHWQAWRDVGMLRPRADEATGDDGGWSSVDAPLVERHRSSPDADTFTSSFSTASWVLDEHRLSGGTALLPGTSYLEMAMEVAGVLAPASSAVEIDEIVFLAPFIADGESRSLTITIDKATGDFVMASGAGAARVEHVRGSSRVITRQAAARLPVEAIRTRCTRTVPEATPNLKHLRVGPRWGASASVRLGDGELLATLRFPSRFASELPKFAMHPALADVATACSLWLAPGYDPDRDFYVPLSYGRVLSLGPLTGEVICHARWNTDTDTAADLAVIDLTIATPAGDPLLVVERFAARRLEPFATLEKPGQASATGIDLADAIRPDEGARAFLNVLRALPLSEVVVGPSSIEELQARAARLSAGGADRPSTGTRRSSAPFADLRDDTDRRIAGIWTELLGVTAIGIDDNFFELGGHSLLLAQVGSRVRKALGAQVPIAVVFEHPTIRRMADYCRSAQVSAPEPALVALPRESLRRAPVTFDDEE